MQSSYNLIKSNAATNGDNRIISTNYNSGKVDNEDGNSGIETIDVNSIIKSYENIGAGIIKSAKKEADSIVLKALEESVISEKVAYDSGYLKGTENGYEDGYKTGYEKALEDTKAKVEEDIDKAMKILSSAGEDYENYMDLKKSEIINLALEMAKAISGKELSLEDGILHLIEPILEKSKGEKNIIIKCNPIHSEAVRARLDHWQKSYAINGEIFILEDTLMEPGNAEVQKNTGKTIVGMDIALEKLEELILK